MLFRSMRANPSAAREIRSSGLRMDSSTPSAIEVEALVGYRQDLLTRIQRAEELHYDNAVSMLPPRLRHLVATVVAELVDSGLITLDGDWLCVPASGAEDR